MFIEVLTKPILWSADKEEESDSSDEEVNVNSVAELSQDIIDDLASKAPVTLARSSSVRQSLRHRRTSSKASRHSKKEPVVCMKSWVKDRENVLNSNQYGIGTKSLPVPQ